MKTPAKLCSKKKKKEAIDTHMVNLNHSAWPLGRFLGPIFFNRDALSASFWYQGKDWRQPL